MRFLTAAYSDKGNVKQTNQDSALVIEAESDAGNILLTAVCDGMGGLAKGEVASSTVIEAFSRWFETDLPHIAALRDPQRELFSDWRKIVVSCHRRISEYAAGQGITMGTTLNAVLFMKGKYYIVNVGDTRAYHLRESVRVLTKDHSYVQREVDMGRMTPEEALVSPQRSVLLQCIGAGEYVEPEFFTGDLQPGETYMQCSDGFRHVITEAEIYQYCSPAASTDEQKMLDNIVYLTNLNKYRRERDNITVILVKTE